MNRSHVDFLLSDPQGSSTIFKTNDTIDGEILFTPHQQVRVENIRISLQGIMRTEVENMYTQVPVPTNVLERPFLRMEHPVCSSLNVTTLVSGNKCRLPFKFVVPQELPVQVCYHECANLQIQQEHLQLPASLGRVSKVLNSVEDMAPETAQITYAIRFEVWDNNTSKGGRAKKIQDAIHPVYILPTRQEIAPLLISETKRYQLQTRKALSRGFLRSSLGALVASAVQPPSLQLHSLQLHNASTTLKINLQFEPTQANQSPPAHVSAQMKLKTFTYYGLEPWHEFPDLTDTLTWGSRKTFWSDTVPLTSSKINLAWSCKLEPDRLIYTTSIEVVATLPSSRMYPPTFHSCFVSRVYALKATLFCQARSKVGSGNSLSLTVPWQICAL